MIQQSVAPVQSIPVEVNRQTIRPAQGQVPKDDQVGAVGVSPADVGRAVPFGEKDVTGVRVDHYRARTLEVLQ